VSERDIAVPLENQPAPLLDVRNLAPSAVPRLTWRVMKRFTLALIFAGMLAFVATAFATVNVLFPQTKCAQTCTKRVSLR
jgi:hypothetical protein